MSACPKENGEFPKEKFKEFSVLLCDSKNKPPAMQGEGRSLDISNLLC